MEELSKLFLNPLKDNYNIFEYKEQQIATSQEYQKLNIRQVVRDVE